MYYAVIDTNVLISSLLSKRKGSAIEALLRAIKVCGIFADPKATGEILVDMDDLVFYEVAMEKRNDNSYLV